jgi:signal transduction histidine kinase
MSIRVLVVEDEARIADFLVRGLREEGYAVEHAADGGAAWAALRSGGWDLVLLDWWLPGEDGLALLPRFRRLDRHTPVLFLTARDAVGDRVRGLDAGADDYLPKPFAFEELLARIRALVRRRDAAEGTALEFRAHLGTWDGHARAGDLHVDLEPGGRARVRAHPALLGQLLDNLLDNAAKYSAPGTPIDVRVWRAGDHAALAVQDRGMGLSPEDRAHLFEPFYRSAEVRRRGYTGVGLGLAVVRRIASVFGRTIEVRSEPGRGSTFMLRLSAVPDSAEESDRPPTARPLSMSQA